MHVPSTGKHQFSWACCLCRQEIEKILRFLPAKSGRQNVMFSATYPPNIQELAGIALNPQRQVVDTVGEEQTHATEQVRSLLVCVHLCVKMVAICTYRDQKVCGKTLDSMSSFECLPCPWKHALTTSRLE